MRRHILFLSGAAVVLAVLIMTIWPGTNGAHQAPGESRQVMDGKPMIDFQTDDTGTGLIMKLREIGAPGGEAETTPQAESTPLEAKALQTLLARLEEPLTPDAADRQSFAFRDGPPPPPRTGETKAVPFPPSQDERAPEQPTGGELTVLRYAPEGEVEFAPHLSITFSEPMVAVTSQEEAAETIPVTLAPTPAGSWRWLGTRTAMFQPEGRFPMATIYEVEIPLGTAAAGGAGLADAESFTFTTPPPGVIRKHPTGEAQPLKPMIFIAFDQKINAEIMLSHVSVTAGRGTHEVRLAETSEIEGEAAVKWMAEAAEPGTWLALLPEESLPAGTRFTVTVEQGAPSAEGPLTTRGPQSFEFRTYDPLRIEETRCGWRDECPPDAAWYVEFNNPLDASEFNPEEITIDPKIEGARIRIDLHTLSISGLKRGRTRYTVTIPAGIKDIFGQQLGKTETVRFDVGPAEKNLFGPQQAMLILDPAGPARFSVHSVNHEKLKVRINRVTPEKWRPWWEWMESSRSRNRGRTGPMPGESLLDTIITVEGENDALAETVIDLSSYLEQGSGQFTVWVEPTVQSKERWSRQEVLVWVQATAIGLTAFTDDKELVAWATRLDDGRPIKGVTLDLVPGGGMEETDEAGLARFSLPGRENRARLLVARKGRDTAILPANRHGWRGRAWHRIERTDRLRWFTFDDRGIYRPGETARVKGWIRRIESGKKGDIRGVHDTAKVLSWRLRGPRGNDLAQGTAALSRLGGFDLSLALPENVNLGSARLELSLGTISGVESTSYVHHLEIQEFRRPEFEVTTETAPGPHILGEEAEATVRASYYAGGGLSAAPVEWLVTASPSHYVPPNRDRFQFGEWIPWWMPIGYRGDQEEAETLEGQTDAAGIHGLGIHFLSLNPPRPMSVTAEATVEDVNRQAWSSSSTFLLHPSSLYVGLRTDRGFIQADETITVETLVVDIEGISKPGAEVELRLVRLETDWLRGVWEEKEHEIKQVTVRSTEDPVETRFSPGKGGVYRLSAKVTDEEGRPNQTRIRFWVAGGDLKPARNVEMEAVTLIPERQSYQPGETASFLIQTPFSPAEGMLTIRRDGLVRSERFSIAGTSRTLEVPILDSYIPEVTVQVDLVGSAPRTGPDGAPMDDVPRRPAFASGNLTFKVPPLKRTMDVSIRPRDTELDPGGSTILDLTVRDADSKPVANAEVVVLAVDESVLALTGYTLPDPISVFYIARGPGVSDFHSRYQITLSDLEDMLEQQGDNAAPGGRGEHRRVAKGGMEPPSSAMAEQNMEMDAMAAAPLGMGMELEESGSQSIAVRSDFSALALFVPEVRTDGDGTAEIPLKLPDSLSRFRIMAVAVAGEQHFGAGESAVTVRLPLMVRPSAPRFLNFGDRFELPVVLQNQTDQPMDVAVAIRAANLELVESNDADASSTGRRVTVPANDRVEVRFPVTTGMAGTARAQVVAAGETAADAATIELPVWTPATSEAFATYGQITEGTTRQPVRAPADVWPQFGGLEVTTTSTQFQELTDAVVYLVEYPYDCCEQIASRLLAVAALNDVLSAFEAEGLPAPDELRLAMKRDLEALKARQNNDGGFPFWQRDRESIPYLTVHVAHALVRARANDYAVDREMWDAVQEYLRDIQSRIPDWYSKKSAWAVRAYALHVLEAMGEPDIDEALELLAKAGVENLSLEAHGWLLPTLKQSGSGPYERSLRHVMNRVTETAGAAHFVTSYEDGAHVLLHSARRADGVLLEALIRTDPRNDLIHKLVRGLLSHRKRGAWSNTQENSFVLLALGSAFEAYESDEPDFETLVWLGEQFVGRHAFRGRSTDRAAHRIPMDLLASGPAEQELVIGKKGAGRLYYRIGMRYAPKSLELDPADYGFTVERTYEAVDEPKDVRRGEDGVWRVRAGARIRVKLSMVAPSRRYHVALVDHLPAGLEPLNTGLAVTGSVPRDDDDDEISPYRWWWWRWYEHENLRDDRVEAFASLLPAGVHSYTYAARATTPGRFVVPPATAEEMYAPETFGRSGSEIVIVD